MQKILQFFTLQNISVTTLSFIMILNLAVFFFIGIERTSAITSGPEAFGYVVMFFYVPVSLFLLMLLAATMAKYRSEKILMPFGWWLLLFILPALASVSTYIIPYPERIHEPLRTFIIMVGLSGLMINTNNEYAHFFVNSWNIVSYAGPFITVIIIWFGFKMFSKNTISHDV